MMDLEGGAWGIKKYQKVGTNVMNLIGWHQNQAVEGLVSILWNGRKDFKISSKTDAI